MITIKAWKDSTTLPTILVATQFDFLRLSNWHLVWIDLSGDDSGQHREWMQNRVGLPRLAVDDALRDRHPPKYENLDDEWHFLLMRGFDVNSTSIKFGTIQLAIFWRDNILVTRHVKSSASVAVVEKALLGDDPPVPERAWSLVYLLLRTVLDLYLPITLKIEARLEEIEELLLAKPSDRLLGELMEFSSQLKRLRRISSYHEKSFVSLTAHAGRLRGLDSAQLTDLHEQAERLHSLSSLLYETTTDLIDGYLSISAHRLNNVMRVLTVVTVLFVPLTFVAGIYGMNFDYIPELKWHFGYFGVISLMITIAAALLVLFRRRKWI
ncbi:MAG: magnesium transporter CorA family protein [Dokdonella sp.]